MDNELRRGEETIIEFNESSTQCGVDSVDTVSAVNATQRRRLTDCRLQHTARQINNNRGESGKLEVGNGGFYGLGPPLVVVVPYAPGH